MSEGEWKAALEELKSSSDSQIYVYSNKVKFSSPESFVGVSFDKDSNLAVDPTVGKGTIVCKV